MKDGSRERTSLARTVARGAGGNVVLLCAGTLLSLLIAILLSRALGPAGLGIYAFAAALSTIVSMPITSALGAIVLRETAGASPSAAGSERVAAAIGWGVRTSIWLVGGTTALLGVAAALWLGDLGGDKTGTVLCALLLPLPVAIQYVLAGAARGMGWVVVGRVPELALRPAFFIVLMVPLLLAPAFGQFTPQAAMLLQGVAALLAMGAAAAIVHSALGKRGGAGLSLETLHAPPPSSGAWLQSLAPLALVFGLSSIQSNIDILMLDWYLPDDQVGIYRASAQAGRLLFTITTAVGAVLLPSIASLHAAGDRVQLERLLLLAARGSLAMLVPAFAVVAAAGPWLLATVFGAPFAAGATVFVLTAAGAVAQGLVGYAASVLSMTGQERQMIGASLASAGANIVLNLLLIPRYGMEGAAAATALAGVALSVALALRVRRLLGLKTWALG